MPGLFGIISSDAKQLKRFSELCQSSSPFKHQVIQTSSYCIGAHAFLGRSLIEDLQYMIAVDGEYSIYQLLANSSRELFTDIDGHIRPTKKSKGNLCILDKSREILHIATDILGSFPLYYSISKDAFVFSSRIKPIGSFLSAEQDNAGIIEFALNGNNINKRTYFKGVSRCRAGELLILNMRNLKLKFDTYSKLWSAQSDFEKSNEVIERASQFLKNSFDVDQQTMVMMSAGWDSRTLLAACVASGKRTNVKAYTHGDINSREIDIVSRICKDTEVELIKQAVSADMYSPEKLRANLDYTENSVFPHWHSAGERAKNINVRQITAGVYGEAFGGHYGPPWVLHGAKKMINVGKYLLNLHLFNSGKSKKGNSFEESAALLMASSISKPWYILSDYWNEHSNEIIQKYNQDIDDILLRYQQRGIETTENYIEAFTTEQRGAQYITSQLLSCRHHVDICLPFADRNYIEFATRLPFGIKVHNKLNQAVINNIAPELLKYPVAATLLSANHSIISQEASRAARKLLEASLWKLHRLSKGNFKEPRMGWVNFQFLAKSNVLINVIESLKQPYWDKKALKAMVINVKYGSYHPLSDMLMKLLSVDYCLDITQN